MLCDNIYIYIYMYRERERDIHITWSIGSLASWQTDDWLASNYKIRLAVFLMYVCVLAVIMEDQIASRLANQAIREKAGFDVFYLLAVFMFYVVSFVCIESERKLAC